MAPPPIVCFLRGTQIWTPDGEKRVEDLRINDLVVTSSGEAKPIQWVWGRCFERQRGQQWDEGSLRFGLRSRLWGQIPPIAISFYHDPIASIWMEY